MKEIILATGNAHKAHEFRDMLPNVRILTLKDLPQPVTIVEDRSGCSGRSAWSSQRTMDGGRNAV